MSLNQYEAYLSQKRPTTSLLPNQRAHSEMGDSRPLARQTSAQHVEECKREVTIIGELQSNLPHMIEQVETQIKMTSQQKQVKKKYVEPIKLNKYVGYTSNHLKVTLDRVEARLNCVRRTGTAGEMVQEKFKFVIYR